MRAVPAAHFVPMVGLEVSRAVDPTPLPLTGEGTEPPPGYTARERGPDAGFTTSPPRASAIRNGGAFVVADQEVQQPGVGFLFGSRLVEVVDGFVHFLHVRNSPATLPWGHAAFTVET
ncbi:MAG TPA: hypothetical protein VKU19_11830 [Bryobacteraceae bacterium]|nr:hypothetical protein [Bryobacteraceae bacterium]